MNHKFRNKKPFFKRVRKDKVYKKTYFIACEGKKSETQYFIELDRCIRGKLNNNLMKIIVLQQGNKEHDPFPGNILVGLIEDTKKHYLSKEFNEKFDERWLVFDRDKGNILKKQYFEIIKICKEEKIEIGITNPCFELWLHHVLG